MTMRSFSSEEKGYLKHIVDAYKSDNWAEMKLINLIQSIFDREFYFNELFPYIQLKNGESGDDKNVVEYSKAIKGAYIPISNFNSLLFYLHSNHLIYIVPYFNPIKSLEEEAESEKNIEQSCTNFFRIEDKSYLEFLRSNLSDFLCPTQELIDFVERKFITKQEKQYKITNVISITGIIVAILISLAGIFTNKTPENSNTFNPKSINNANENRHSVMQKTMAVDSLKVKQSKNKLMIKK